MWSVTVITLLAFHAKKLFANHPNYVQDSDGMVDKFVDRRLNVPGLHSAELDKSTLLKPKLLEIPFFTPKVPKIKLSYFPIEAAAEKVRLTLVMTSVEFEDVRIPFTDWQAMKASGATPYGQLPIMELTYDDGHEQKCAQSGAMMRWIARKFDKTGTLYPADADKMFVVEEALGLVDDLQKAWSPSLYLGLRHTAFGYPEEWTEKASTVERLRKNFLANDLPKFMGFFSDKLEKSGAFLCGDKPTIADLTLLPQLRYFTQGSADYVPKDCLAPYTTVLEWMDRMYAIPQIKAWYKM